MMIFDPHKLGWLTRIRLCWTVLTTGDYNPREYRTRHLQEQWNICRRRDMELQEGSRPRTNFELDSEYMDQ